MEKIKEQIEFYFSDSNYSRDCFLQEIASKNNGYVPIETILSFQRMKALSATPEQVLAAVKNSPLVEVNGEALKKVETPAYLEYKNSKDIGKRIVYMKGFDKSSELDGLKALLSKYCRPVKILMKRDENKQFTGSCFVEFATEKEATDSLDLQIEVEREKEETGETSKKMKSEPEYVAIEAKAVYDARKKTEDKKTDKKSAKEEKFIEKVKNDFIPKLYKMEEIGNLGGSNGVKETGNSGEAKEAGNSSEAKETGNPGSLSIEDVKEMIKNVAFVDLEKKVIRMKYREEWEENEFEKGGKKIKLVKMGAEEARAYVDGLKIKKVPKKAKK